MLLLDVVTLDKPATAQIPVAEQPAWYVGQLVLAVLGIIVQLRSARRRELGSVRRTWSAPA